MKKLWNVLVLTLALNFLVLAGGVGYLYFTKKIDKGKAHAIREIVFPPPEPAAPATQPSDAATEPSLNLDQLLAAHAHLPAAEQVQMIERTADFRMRELEQRHRELTALHDLVKNAETKLTADRAAFEKRLAALDAREQEAARLAADKGFQDSLKLYGTMKPKQIKDVFAGLADDVVVRYLRAMDTRTASKVIKEFTTPAELERVKVLMEQVRSAESAAPAKQ